MQLQGQTAGQQLSRVNGRGGWAKEHRWERPLCMVGNSMLLFFGDMRDQTQGLIHARQAQPQSHNPQPMVEVFYILTANMAAELYIPVGTKLR